MANNDSDRQRIISSVFSRRNAAGGLEEYYGGHVKIWEDGPGGDRKPRYILISQASNGTGFIHKSKQNANGTFSVGKTWRLEELQGVEIVNPLSFNVTLARTYRWQTENSADQYNFVVALVRLFHTVTGGHASLQVEGLEVPEDRQGSTSTSQSRRRADTLRSRTPSQNEFQPENSNNGRPPSPTDTIRRTINRTRSQTPTQRPTQTPPPLASSTSRTNRRPSIASSTTSSIPSVQMPASSTSPSYSKNLPSSTSPPSSKLSSNLLSSASTQPKVPSMNLPPGPTLPAKVSRRPSREDNSLSKLAPTLPGLSKTGSQDNGAYPLSAGSAYSPSTTFVPRSKSASPARSDSSTSRQQALSELQRRDAGKNARISFFDPTNRAALERLFNTRNGDGGEEESVAMTLASMEEMLDAYEWSREDVADRKVGSGSGSEGTADLIEARLFSELMALEKANIYSFLVGDNRVAVVCKYLDEAISELDNMSSLVSSYKIHLNAVGDDISYIQSENRGVQVQTQNQRVLLNELENLLQTVQVDKQALVALTQESLEKTGSIQRLEDAATELYKALQAGRDRGMAATMERLDEYRTHNAQFCKRIFDFLTIMFTAQSQLLLRENEGITKASNRASAVPHKEIEAYLGRYSGLMLYVREMDENIYAKLCAAYFSAASDLHNKQTAALLAFNLTSIKRANEDEQEQVVPTSPTNAYRSVGIHRSATLMKSPLDRRKERDKPTDGTLRASEVFVFILGQIASLIMDEDNFVTQFLHINDTAYTFAEHMRLDNYFRRQAARGATLSSTTTKLVRGAMDLIFGFLPAELTSWLDNAIGKDRIEIVGITAALERFLFDADERGNTFLQSLLEKQLTRLKALLERQITAQITAVEETKLTSKKRQGVASFIKKFPSFIARVESQLVGAEGLEIRVNIDNAYERIVDAMFDCLKQMAKMEGEGEDKGQLNYHVILIDNMHFFASEMAQMEVGSVAGFLRKAQTIYDENVSAYVKLVLRRPFAKIIDYFEGVERLMKTTAPSEVSRNSSYNKSALKKVLKEFNAKDIRKHVDALFKRVEKHFTEGAERTGTEENNGIAPGSALAGVWKVCEEELVRITELFNKRVSQCYADSGMSLDYSVSDVEAAFRRHR